MLRHLHVSDLALIEECHIDLDAGMVALTGETGAGKSLLMEALGLLAGSRATPSLVRSGEERATVEALFEVQKGPFATVLADLGLEGDNAGEVILRREISAAGRSRASINGRMVPLAQLQEVAGHLMEVGGQHDQVALLNPAQQRSLFDDHAGTSALAARVRGLWEIVQELRRELASLEAGDKLRDQRRELLRFQLRELEEAALEEGEQERLLHERQKLASSERLMALAGLAAACLGEAPPGENAAIDLLDRATASVEEAAEIDEELAPIAQRLADLHEVLAQATADLTRYAGRCEADPARLQEIDERLMVLKRILKKHGPTEAEALRALEVIRAEVEGEESLDERREELAARAEAAHRQLEAAVLDLTAARARAVESFCKPLVAILRDFAMPKVRFDVRLTPVTAGVPLADGRFAGSEGAEDVEFFFSANDGEALQPLRRVASGGELSRVLLALRTLGARESHVPLLVFDEVDAGLSGIAARRVGERLAALAKRTQVLCVTHNANVAALADQHLLAEKRSERGRTMSEARLIHGLERERELARLLDGGKQSEKGLALAAELLSRSA